MAEHGKKFVEAAKLVEDGKEYSPEEASALVKKTARAKFDETVELHIRMGLDPRQATQQVRGVALMPYGLGKQVKVLVFAQGEAEKAAKSAGADYVGADDIIKKIEECFHCQVFGFSGGDFHRRVDRDEVFDEIRVADLDQPDDRRTKG